MLTIIAVVDLWLWPRGKRLLQADALGTLVRVESSRPVNFYGPVIFMTSCMIKYNTPTFDRVILSRRKASMLQASWEFP